MRPPWRRHHLFGRAWVLRPVHEESPLETLTTNSTKTTWSDSLSDDYFWTSSGSHVCVFFSFCASLSFGALWNPRCTNHHLSTWPFRSDCGDPQRRLLLSDRRPHEEIVRTRGISNSTVATAQLITALLHLDTCPLVRAGPLCLAIVQDLS